jgi:hypothetical protein
MPLFASGDKLAFIISGGDKLAFIISAGDDK